MTNTPPPSRRDALKLLFSSAAATLDPLRAAEKRAGNPFFTKDRDRLRKELEAKPYKRNVAELAAIAQTLSATPLTLLVLDVDKINPQALLKNPHESDYFAPLQTWFADEARTLKEINALAEYAENIQQGRIAGGMAMTHVPGREPVRIVMCDTQNKHVNYNNRFGLPAIAKLLLSSGIQSPHRAGQTHDVVGLQQVSQAEEWGFKDNLNAPVYRAFSDYVLAARAAHMQLTTRDSAQTIHFHHAIAESYAALKLAQQYGSSYPARIVAATHTIEAIYGQTAKRTYPDIGHSIPASVPHVTGFCVEKAAEVAEEILRLDPERLQVMSDKDLYDTAELIAQTYALSASRLDYLDAKAKAIMKQKTVALTTAQDAIANPKLLNPDIPIDQMIINAHLLLFAKLKTKAQGQAR